MFVWLFEDPGCTPEELVVGWMRRGGGMEIIGTKKDKPEE
jgi:hypothetical protein